MRTRGKILDSVVGLRKHLIRLPVETRLETGIDQNNGVGKSLRERERDLIKIS